MKKLTQKEVNDIVAKHTLWLDDDTKGVMADFSYTVLESISMYGFNLRGATFEGAIINNADLSFTIANGANFNRAKLNNVSFYWAELQDAKFHKASIMHVMFSLANLKRATFAHATLSLSTFSEAKLNGVDLTNTHIEHENSFIRLRCPEKGSFTAFKRTDFNIVELVIPASAKRSSATTNKCRASKAKVKAIYELNGSKSEKTAVPSMYDHMFYYEIGKTVVVDNFDEDRWNECSTGIHFFMSFGEAVQYY